MDSCSFQKDMLKPISNDNFKIDFETIQTTESGKFMKNLLTKKVKRNKISNKSKEK